MLTSLISNSETNALVIELETYNIISLPTQLGCPVRCTFCVSSTTSYIRNLSVSELLDLYYKAYNSLSRPHLPLELSFSGEGESSLNIGALREFLSALPSSVTSIKITFSGIKSERLLNLHTAVPLRYQCSLHCATQHKRDKLIPHSVSLDILRQRCVELSKTNKLCLNIVLQDGVNHSDEDFKNLVLFIEGTSMEVVFNPLMRTSECTIHEKSYEWSRQLNNLGFVSHVYQDIGKSIVKNNQYIFLTRYEKS